MNAHLLAINTAHTSTCITYISKYMYKFLVKVLVKIHYEKSQSANFLDLVFH